MNRTYLLILFFVVIITLPLLIFEGTGDSGDSILHYLAAKYAFQNPELFFDHWAKPFYVFLAAPFAQFGIPGIKIFNVFTALLTCYFTWKVAQKLQIKHNWIIPFFIICSPLYFKLLYSGLTEPLFACLLMYSIWLVFENRLIWGLIAVSFLPFVRSEGLVIVGVFGLYLLFQKDWKKLPWLALGHVVYSFLGSWTHGSLFWVFKKIPYATTAEVYGSGDWAHYLVQMNYTVGVPIYILFWLGVLWLLMSFFRNPKISDLNTQVLGFREDSARRPPSLLKEEQHRKYLTRFILSNFSNKELFLIYGSLFAFLLAHTIFWTFGIFKSFGLNRVLIAVVPLMALIALRGLNFLLNLLPSKLLHYQKMLGSLILFFILLFPFTSNPAAINWQKDMNLSTEQQLAKEVAAFLKTQNFSDTTTWNFSAPYLAEVMKLNPYDWKKRRNISRENLQNLKKGDVVIWDDWFAVVDSGVSLEMVSSLTNLELLKVFEQEDEGRSIQFVIFTKH